MPKLEQRERALSRLHLDLLNPRVGRGVLTEHEAMIRLLEVHGDQILALAKDIAAHGLNPLDIWGIVDIDGKTVVVEGNRRLLACRLLLKPDRAPDQRWQQRFGRIALQIHPSELEKVQCVKAPSRADMRHWMNLKHQGPGDGEGVAQWTPEMKYLDRVQQGKAREADKEFWYWLEQTYSDDIELVRDIIEARDHQFTTMQRVFDWFLKDKLDATLDGDALKVQANTQELQTFFSVLMQAMSPAAKQTEEFIPRDQQEAFPAINSRSLHDAQKAQDVLERIWKRTVDENRAFAPSDNEPQVESTNGEQAEPNSRKAAKGGRRQSSDATKESRSVTVSNDEKYLYYGVKSYVWLPIRIRKLLEAAHRIDISRNPDVAGVIARVVFELLVDYYIREQKLIVKEKDTLADKARKVLLHLDPALNDGKSGLPELRWAYSAIIKTGNDGHLIKDLNSCVHGLDFTDPQGVADRANRVLTPVMVAMINKIRDTKKL